jgi:hypothetical protein
MASKTPPPSSKRADEAASEAKQLHKDLRQTVKQAMARAGVLDDRASKDLQDALRQARRKPLA